MALTLGPILLDAGIDLSDALVIRHAYVREHEDSGISGIHADSTDAEILEYTRNQSANPRRFPADPPRFWVVFIREGGDQARLWAVVDNRGEVANDGVRRIFDMVVSEHMVDLRGRLVVMSRQVVESADRCPADRGVSPVLIVEVDPAR